jgi:ATP synthase, F0 subunit b
VNVTATLIGQMITFAIFVWFIQRYLWGPLTRMLEERKKRVAEGLAAGERGKREQALAEQHAQDLLQDSKRSAAEIIAQAQKRATEIIEESKADARAEGERLLIAARAEIEQEINRAKEQLREQVAALAIAGAEKILGREIDAEAHSKMLEKLSAEI